MRLFTGSNTGWASQAIACIDEDGRIYRGSNTGWASQAIACVDVDGRVYKGSNTGWASQAIACVDDDGRIYSGSNTGWASQAVACIDENGRIYRGSNTGWASQAVACVDEYYSLREIQCALGAYFVMMANIGSSGSSGGSGGCFLTTACVKAKNLPDDCDELTALRAYRDGWLANQPYGKEEIELYYKIAPGIVAKIDTLDDKDAIYEGIYNNVIIPCIALINEGKNEETYKLYKKATMDLKEKYLG